MIMTICCKNWSRENLLDSLSAFHTQTIGPYTVNMYTVQRSLCRVEISYKIRRTKSKEKRRLSISKEVCGKW